MRKVTWFIVIGLIVGLVSLPAEAVINAGPGKVTGHMYDASNLYADHDGNPQTPMLPRPIAAVPAAPAIGDENRAVFSMDQFVPGSDLANDPSVELTGLFYNLELVAVGGAFPTVTLYFAESSAPGVRGRNGLLPGTDIDGDIAGINYGGVIELYEDYPQNLDLSPGPAAWVEGQPGLRDSYPTATDGTLWLEGVLVEVPSWTLAATLAAIPSAGQPIVFLEALNWGLPIPGGLGTYTGHGEGYVNVFGGSFEGAIGRGTYNSPIAAHAGADVQLQINMDLALMGPGYGTRIDPSWGWQVESNDPVRFQVIPEPTIMLLFGGSILGGLIRRRRRL